jgi:chromosome segregation ATPase
VDGLKRTTDDKIEPLNMHGHANTFEEELQEVCKERDALRASLNFAAETDTKQTQTIIALRARLDEIEAAWAKASARAKEINAENERLTKAEGAFLAEIKQLQGELAHARSTIEQFITAVRWNEEQRDIQAKEIERLRLQMAEYLEHYKTWDKALAENERLRQEKVGNGSS